MFKRSRLGRQPRRALRGVWPYLCLLLLMFGGVGCEPVPSPPRVSQRVDGLDVRREAGVDRVVLVDPDGLPVLTRRLPAEVPELRLSWDWQQAGSWTVVVSGDDQRWELPLDVTLPGPVAVSLQAPIGQDPQPLVDGDQIDLVLVDGQPAEVALRVQALRAGPVSLRLGSEHKQAQLRVGEVLTLRAQLAADAPIQIDAQGKTVSAWLRAQVRSRQDLATDLRLAAIDLPADRMGQPELGRPAGRVTLPASWWRGTLRALGLGSRPQDPWAPWSHVGVAVVNDGDEPLNMVVRLRLLDEQGQPAPAFSPHIREGAAPSEAVSVLLRVPAHAQARAALPLFVDERLLGSDVAADQRWQRVVDLLPLGSPAVIATDRAPLYVSRGSSVASLGLVMALAAALAGSLLLLRRGPRWLSTAATSELMTISLFGSLSFIVGAVGRLLTMGVATVLGPFASLLTGLADDCLRYALLATLVSLQPRVGTASLAVLVSWLLSGFALGTFSPTDIIFVGGRVFWLESLLWLAGITRGRAWLDEGPVRRWLRLSVGFGGASLLTSATGLVLHMTLYRLFLADWYVALVLGLPGFLYVVLACAIAAPFADSLRRVQR